MKQKNILKLTAAAACHYWRRIFKGAFRHQLWQAVGGKRTARHGCGAGKGLQSVCGAC